MTHHYRARVFKRYGRWHYDIILNSYVIGGNYVPFISLSLAYNEAVLAMRRSGALRA